MQQASAEQLGLPSRTAIWAATARAIGARSPEAQWKNPDHLAEKLLGDESLDLISDHALARALRDGFDPADRTVIGSVFTLLIRTRFIDRYVTEAAGRGVRQVVLLGAGFDTRGYRLSEQLPEIRWFEVDHPATQVWKRRRAEEAIGPSPEKLTYVPVDFRHDSLEAKLQDAGYDAAAPTAFVWEGVTMYLPEEAVRDTLGWISRQAGGTTVVFDYADRLLVDILNRVRAGEAVPFPTEAAREGVQRALKMDEWNEPWIFGIPAGGESDFLWRCGLELESTMAMASREAAERFADWDPAAPFPEVPRQMYSIGTARVPRQ